MRKDYSLSENLNMLIAQAAKLSPEDVAEIKRKDLTTQKKRRALMPTFETEEQALTYAQDVTRLRAGGLAKLLNEDDTGLHLAVYTGQTDAYGRPMFLTYDTENKRLITQVCGWHSVVLI